MGRARRADQPITVSVDPATGSVYGLVRYEKSFAPPPSPKLALEDALAVATTEEKDPGLKVRSADLEISIDSAGTQSLVYSLQLERSDGFLVWIDVDAMTGEATVMGRG